MGHQAERYENYRLTNVVLQYEKACRNIIILLLLYYILILLLNIL